MLIVDNISDLKKEIRKIKKGDKIIGFIPTMGSLHSGHISLIKEGIKHCDYVVVSIFLNPIQFENRDDLIKYPKSFENDIEICSNLGVDLIFNPDDKTLYPDSFQTIVSVKNLQKGLCGDKREGHFDGVTTVVIKLFNLVQPDISFFGEKDYQQFLIIKKMVEDLNIPIKIISVSTVRDSYGLAESSRNRRLSLEGIKKARKFPLILKKGIEKYKNGELSSKKLLSMMENLFKNEGIKIDYIEFRDKNDLSLVDQVDQNSRLFSAIYIENIRLIDNFGLE